VQLPKTQEGLGMTLRNNPMRNGVVVWTCEPDKLAERAGLRVGDVVLSVEDHLLESIENLVEYVSEAQGVINMELAGTAPSRLVTVVKSKDRPVGLGLQPTSCGVGILISELDPAGSASSSSLKVGDIILSIDSTVPASAKHAVQLIGSSDYCIKFVTVGIDQSMREASQKSSA
jgi:S1-C subfamily serine protease